MKAELLNVSISQPTHSISTGRLLSVMQQALTDLGWEDLRPAIYAAEQVNLEIAAELAAAHQDFLKEPTLAQCYRLKNALDKAIDKLKSEYHRVLELKHQAEWRIAQSHRESSSFILTSLGHWFYQGLQRFFDSDDASLITRYSEIAQNSRKNLVVLRDYRSGLEEIEAGLESKVKIGNESVRKFAQEFSSSQTHAQKLLTVDSDEFQVNTNTIGSQSYPSTATFNDGGFIVAWAQDGGDGVYAQRYSVGGVKRGYEFRVNTYNRTGYVWYPSVAVFSHDGFVITWASDGQDGSSYGIYARLYDTQGVALGSEFKVNTYTINAQQKPSVSTLNDGGFLIAWQSYLQDNDFNEIYAQRYNALGVPLGNEFRVNTNTTRYQQNPRVASLSNGGFVIVWDAYEQDGYAVWSVYGQRYDASSMKLGEPFRVMSTYPTGDQWYPRVAAFRSGGFVITWNFYRPGYKNSVYAQRYDNNGMALDSEFQVTSPIADELDSSVATFSNNSFIIAWRTKKDGSGDEIYARSYSASGIPLNNDFRVNTYTINDQYWPSIATFKEGGFVAAWMSNEQDGDGYGVYARLFYDVPVLTPTPTSVIPLTDEFRVNSYVTRTQGYPSVGTFNDNSFVIAWMSVGQDGDGWGLYAQRYSSDGMQLGNEFRVNTYTTNSQGELKLGTFIDGSFVIVWQSFGQDGDGYGVYAQLYSANAVPLGSEFQVNVNTLGHQHSPDLGSSSSGKFIITWASSGLSSDIDIYARRYDLLGGAISGEFQVNTYRSGSKADPQVGVFSDGGFVIVWESDKQDGDGSGIYAQRYDRNGVVLGNEFRVNTYTLGDQQSPSIDTFSDGGFVITWESKNNNISSGQDGSGTGIFAQRYNVNGIALGSEFQVNTFTLSNQGYPNIRTFDNLSFIIAWSSNLEDGSNTGTSVYAQLYDVNGTSIGNEFLVTHTLGDRGPRIGVFNDRGFVIAWSGLQYDGENDFDVYARIFTNITLPLTNTSNIFSSSSSSIATSGVSQNSVTSRKSITGGSSSISSSSSVFPSSASSSTDLSSGASHQSTIESSTGMSISRISSSSSSRNESFNRPPYLQRSIPSHTVETQRPFRFNIERDTFIDPDDDRLTWSAELADHSVLPDGINFAASSQTFSGLLTDLGVWNVSIRVRDGEGLSAQGFFNLQLVSTQTQVDLKTWVSVASVLSTLLVTIGGYCWRRSKLSSERRQYPLASDLRDQLKLVYDDLQRGSGKIYADWVRDMSINVSTTLHLNPKIGRVMREHHSQEYQRYLNWFREAIQQERIILPTTVCGIRTRSCCRSYNLPINELEQHRQNIEIKVINNALKYYDKPSEVKELNHYAFMNLSEAVPDEDIELGELKGQENPLRIAGI